MGAVADMIEVVSGLDNSGDCYEAEVVMNVLEEVA